MSRARTFTLIAVALLVGAVAALAQQMDFSKVEIKSTPLAEGVWMLEGAGGNIGVCAGEGGVLLIDDQFAELSERVKSAVAGVSNQPVRFVLNTHWHPDHVGGNENFANAGAVIVAHENARRRVTQQQPHPMGGTAIEPLPAKAWPVATFSDSMTFHLSGKTLHVYHLPPAHTDGDAMVWIPEANVLHAGDCLFNGMYPVIQDDRQTKEAAAGCRARRTRAFARSTRRNSLT